MPTLGARYRKSNQVSTFGASYRKSNTAAMEERQKLRNIQPTITQGDVALTSTQEFALSRFGGTLQTIADLQTEPLSAPGERGFLDIVGGAFKAGFQTVVDSTEKLFQSAASFDAAFAGGVFKGRTPSEKAGATLELGSSLAHFTLTPITSAFAISNEVPALGSLARFASLPFSALAEGSALVIDETLDLIPNSVLPQASKEHLRDGLTEVAALVVQLGAMGLLFKGTTQGRTGIKPPFLEKVPGVKPKLTEAQLDLIVDNPHLINQIERIPPSKAMQLERDFGFMDAQTLMKISAEKMAGTFGQIQTAPIVVRGGTVAEGLGAKYRFPETKTDLVPGERVGESGLARTLERDMIAREINADFGHLPEYGIRNMKEAASRADALVRRSPQLARDIVNRRSPIPEDMLYGEVYSALARNAVRRGDVEFARELAFGKAKDVAIRSGQEVKAFDTGLRNDPIGAMRDIAKVRESATVSPRRGGELTKSQGVKIRQEKTAEMKKVKSSIKTEVGKIKTWEQFIDSIKC